MSHIQLTRICWLSFTRCVWIQEIMMIKCTFVPNTHMWWKHFTQIIQRRCQLRLVIDLCHTVCWVVWLYCSMYYLLVSCFRSGHLTGRVIICCSWTWLSVTLWELFYCGCIIILLHCSHGSLWLHSLTVCLLAWCWWLLLFSHYVTVPVTCYCWLSTSTFPSATLCCLSGVQVSYVLWWLLSGSVH